MESELIKIASSQGIWAALSVALIFLYFKSTRKERYKTRRERAKLPKYYYKPYG